MVADIEMIRDKLVELETCVRELESLQKHTLEDLQKNLTQLWAVIHGLQLSIQILLDIGNHLLADMGINVKDYTEIIDRLGVTGVIPVEFAQKIRGMAGFRNVLVHGYATLDAERVYHTLHNNLGDFLRFAACVSAYTKE